MTLGHPGADRPGDHAAPVGGTPGGLPGETSAPAAESGEVRADPMIGDPRPSGTEPSATETGGSAVTAGSAVTGGSTATGARTATATDQERPTSTGRPRRKRHRLSFMQELPFLVLAALVLAIVIKAFVVQAFYIPSDSMEQTLHGCPGCHGDRVMVNKLSYDFHSIHRGDIIVFDGKDNYRDQVPVTTTSGNVVQRALHRVADWVGLAPEGTDYIKRVIGLPGDRVACCDSKGRVTVNGHALDETYIYIDQPGYDMHFNQVVVPKGHVFVMGDHRNDSYDSRVPTVGAIPTKDVIGRAFVTIWPPSRWRWLSQPKTFHDWPQNTASAAVSPLGISSALVLGASGAVRLRRRRRARSAR